MAWCPPIPSEKSSTRGTRLSSMRPLSIGTRLTSTVIWRPSRPHPPPRPPPREWVVRPPTARVRVLQSLRHPQGEWPPPPPPPPPPVLVGEGIVEGPLRPVPPAVDAAALPQEESREEVVPHPCLHPHPCPWEPVPREDDLDKVKKNREDVDRVEEEEEDEDEDEDVRPVPTRRPPCHGHPPVAPNKAPLKRLLIKPICNDGCACYSKTKNKLRQDDALPTSPPPTAS